jgi:prepilin-type N-terminal cleavage/methylation domain-containing protein
MRPASHSTWTSARSARGFTLSEMMVALGLFIMAVTGLVYSQLFGLRQDELVNSKSGACELARLSFNDMMRDIRGSKIWQIGNGNLTNFSSIPMNSAQQGASIKLSLTIDTNQYIVYFFDTNQCALYRQHTGDAHPKVLAKYLTNTMYFQAQTYSGAVQTTLSHKGVIDVLMQFCQYQYPITRIGPNYYYNYYKMELRATPHVPDGS